MNVLIFGGFLGSGKTTALMQLARYIVDHAVTESPNKVMILENEIGEIGIDDKFLRSGGFRVDNSVRGLRLLHRLRRDGGGGSADPAGI